ncbi:MAG TPA: protein kinase [Aggregatilineaceae bacterium]|nr:protein kinase [Aggregatilineaceae bacterium]
MGEEIILVAGRYQQHDQIGHGGMGDVYRGADTHTGEPVAIKRLHQDIVEDNPDIVDRFRREGEALRQLNHPNIVKLLDAVEEDAKQYLIMEYVGGGSLRDLLDEQSRLPMEAVLNIALDLADALTRAHRMNIIHRDIKPDNVLLAEDGTPRLTDFGVARLGDRSRLTQSGSVIGTYAYLSPEACNGLELDERADIWSFGVMLFEMLAGRVPFQETSTAAILTAILTKPAPDLQRLRPGTPPALIDLIHRMLEKDRDRRIASVRLIGAELEAIIRGLDTPLRDLMLGASQQPHVGSRFATPSDESGIPAMLRSTPQQTHGLSVYSPGHSPGTTPITSEMAAVSANKWRWIGLAVIATVAACALVAVVAILSQQQKPKATPGEVGIPGGGQSVAEGSTGAELRIARVEAVQPDEYMVLVAQVEDLAGVEQLSGIRRTDIAQFIVNDLEQTLERTLPFSNIQVRKYPYIITSYDEALAAAQANEATVVVWGSSTPDVTELEVQVGVTTAFHHIEFERALLERTANARVRLTDIRRQSIAPYVLGVLSTLHVADGNAYEAMRTAAIEAAIQVTPAVVVGNGIAADVQRQMMETDVDQALKYLNSAIEQDASNPLLYIYSCLLKQRQKSSDAARRDAETAQRIGPPGWTMPALMLAGLSDDQSPQTVLDLFSQIITQRPDDWFPLFFRGTTYYYLDGAMPNAYDLARADLDAAMALKPNANFPYVYSALLAIHEGRLEDAGKIIKVILTEFPDPSYMSRLLGATFGITESNAYSVTLSAFTNLALGRHEAVIKDTTAGLKAFPTLADLYFMQGISYCALGNALGAKISFSDGLQRDPDFTLGYLLRADALLQLGNPTGADADFQVVANRPFSAEFEPLVTAIQAGTLDCSNLFSPDNPFIGPMDQPGEGATNGSS